jgi:mRNA interferase MazF
MHGASGRDQAGHRPVVIITKDDFNERTGRASVCPITSNMGDWTWKVFIPKKSNIEGAILIDQVRTIDLKNKKIEIVGKLDKTTLSEVLYKLKLLLG